MWERDAVIRDGCNATARDLCVGYVFIDSLNISWNISLRERADGGTEGKGGVLEISFAND